LIRLECRDLEDDAMKHFLMPAIALAALAVSGPLSAQPAPTNSPPAATNAPAPVQSLNRMPAGGRATSERGLTGSVERAHHRRHAARASTHASQSQPTGTADQLNRQELTNVQSGSQAGNPTTMNRMSVGGRATSGGPNQ
jgi:hypothetical protein